MIPCDFCIQCKNNKQMNIVLVRSNNQRTFTYMPMQYTVSFTAVKNSDKNLGNFIIFAQNIGWEKMFEASNIYSESVF